MSRVQSSNLVPLTQRHASEMRRIFNTYVAKGFAAYPEKPLSEEGMLSLLQQTAGYPAVAAEASDGTLVGFGFVRPYSPHSTFAETGLVSYFIEASQTRRGIGTTILQYLTEQARGLGITKILAHVSSRNPESLAFHEKHGFVKCGCFPGIGRKWDKPFDVIWMIKELREGI